MKYKIKITTKYGAEIEDEVSFDGMPDLNLILFRNKLDKSQIAFIVTTPQTIGEEDEKPRRTKYGNKV